MKLFRGEVLERTLHFYFLAPVRRELVVAGKYLAGVTINGVVFGLSTIASYLILFSAAPGNQLEEFVLKGPGMGHLFDYVGVTLLACLGYGSVFLLTGLVFRNPIVPAAVVLGWEYINFLLPPFMAHASSLDLSLTYGSNPLSFRSDSTSGMMFTAQWLNYYDLSSSTYLEFRLSGVAGKKDGYEGIYNSYAGSAGMTLKWAPVGREKYRTLEWKTEYLVGFQDQEEFRKQSNGFYSSLRGKMGARFWIGGRVGYSELPDDPSQSAWEFAFNVDFWQSEFVATRIQYQYNHRDMISRPGIPGPYPSDHSLVIQVNWAMGPHKHEAY